MSAIPTTELHDGPTIPVFGLGTWGLSEDRNAFDIEVAAPRTGIDAGIILIDTAAMYVSRPRFIRMCLQCSGELSAGVAIVDCIPGESHAGPSRGGQAPALAAS